MEAGKEEGLRQGFSSGFASGLAIATPWALLRGQIQYVARSIDTVFNLYYTPPTCSSLILHHGRLGGGVAGDTPPTTPVLTELQELLGSVRAEEVRWRESKIALERQAYHAELNKPTTPSELSHERGGDIAMETDEPAVVRGGSQVRYQDVAENADVPQIVHTFKERLEAITAMKKL